MPTLRNSLMSCGFEKKEREREERQKKKASIAKQKARILHEQLAQRLYRPQDVLDALPNSIVDWHGHPSVYTLYNADGIALYVGKSINPAQRISNHMEIKPFASQISEVGIKQYPTKADMDLGELITIQAKSPLHNKDCCHNEKPERLRIEGDVEELRISAKNLPSSGRLESPVVILAKNCCDDSWTHREDVWRRNPQMEIKKERNGSEIAIFSKGETFIRLGIVSKESSCILNALLKSGLVSRLENLRVEIVDKRCIGSPHLLLRAG